MSNSTNTNHCWCQRFYGKGKNRRRERRLKCCWCGKEETITGKTVSTPIDGHGPHGTQYESFEAEDPPPETCPKRIPEAPPLAPPPAAKA